MEIIIASNNKNKIKEIKSMMNNVEVLTLKDIGFDEEIEETGKTFKENAYIKAKTIYDKYHKPVIADDSGLCVTALGNEPGVYSHRYASLLCDDNLNNQLLIKNLKGISNREAYYECAICYYNKEAYFSEGRCYGRIIDNPRGENGFGYDPYFYIDDLKKTMAELSLDEKNQISHRSKAILRMKEILNELYRNI